MITLCRSKDRHQELCRGREVWQTFHTNGCASTFATGMGTLKSFSEDRLPPGSDTARYSVRDAEILTYVHQGALAFEDSTGCYGVLRTGEFQCISAGRGIFRSDRNASMDDWAHVFRVWLRAAKSGLAPGNAQKRFSVAERRGGLRLVVSPDAQQDSLCVRQDAQLHSAMLHRGQHVVHELQRGRSAWIHLVQGEAVLAGTLMATGDSIGVSDERAASLTAMEPSEILLLDVAAQPHLLPGNGAEVHAGWQ